MDAGRYKKGNGKPKKRFVNADDSLISERPKLFARPGNLKQPSKNSTSASDAQLSDPNKQLGNTAVSPAPQNTKPNSNDRPILFDDDDDDIFGVWKKQKDIKKARQAEIAKAKAAKKAAKMLKKQQKSTPTSGSRTEIAISVSLPKLSKPKVPRRIPGYNPLYKKYYFAVASLLLLPFCLITVASFINNNDAKPTTKKPEVQGRTVAAKPDFNTLKPTTTDNKATEARYDTTKKVASYNDVLKDVPITVSQQPLPEKFIKDPTGEVASLAKEINANDKISTSDATAYAGVSIKGPQTVVFTKNDLLVFIIADKKIDQLAWADYIEKLQ